ncbi:hypothetical protein ACFOEE_18735 [Pseudoalteromonas fenneropenaei]|uniref:Uncharacterized protein n=1 Tax=Pseudoalteromonas fenneropenaei TaxID=1737459 RepID=A0ABV7CPK6_9GAMM
MTTPHLFQQPLHRLDLSRVSGCRTPWVVAQFIETALQQARSYQSNNVPLLQEWLLRNTCNALLEVIVDPLVYYTQRQHCLDQLYKPLLALKRFYREHQALPRYWRFADELKTQCDTLFAYQ